jgi:hypothetical protein
MMPVLSVLSRIMMPTERVVSVLANCMQTVSMMRVMRSAAARWHIKQLIDVSRVMLGTKSP